MAVVQYATLGLLGRSSAQTALAYCVQTVEEPHRNAIERLERSCGRGRRLRLDLKFGQENLSYQRGLSQSLL